MKLLWKFFSVFSYVHENLVQRNVITNNYHLIFLLFYIQIFAVHTLVYEWKKLTIKFKWGCWANKKKIAYQCNAVRNVENQRQFKEVQYTYNKKKNSYNTKVITYNYICQQWHNFYVLKLLLIFCSHFYDFIWCDLNLLFFHHFYSYCCNLVLYLTFC